MWAETMKIDKPEGALLGGVCAAISGALNWNVWVLRALFVVFLLFKTVVAVAVYAGVAILMHLALHEKGRKDRRDRSGLASPELYQRSRRIEELERRFRELNDSNRGRDRGTERESGGAARG